MREVKNKYAGKRPRGRRPSKQDPFEEVRLFVPRWLMARVRRKSDIKGVTPDRLILRALWNTRDHGEFFDMDFALNTHGGSTAEEQSRIFQYLCAARSAGIELELLIMCYEDLGFLSVTHIKDAISDLIYIGLANIFNGPEGEIRIAAVVEGKIREKGFRLFGGKKL